MIQIMYSNFESIIYQIASKMWQNVVPFRDKVEGGSKIEGFFEVCQCKTPFRPPCCVHIVCEDKSELFSLRPS
jgi:hypothetical protein